MTRSAGRPVVHEIVGGFCRTCGDTEEWLRERYGAAAVVDLTNALEGLDTPEGSAT